MNVLTTQEIKRTDRLLKAFIKLPPAACTKAKRQLVASREGLVK